MAWRGEQLVAQSGMGTLLATLRRRQRIGIRRIGSGGAATAQHREETLHYATLRARFSRALIQIKAFPDAWNMLLR